ncbi:HNH endonuclease [Geomonas propionica]|uniref:HNH endonuclease n=1 Tax=Geomonas propionica TaxID=2798582 RepID=A0ABS0YXN2_9BACT|nr:HNH endonuclease [Geomonas propionica]MBJ6802613.1 HNH endonuclease [Geomonas propionica]
MSVVFLLLFVGTMATVAGTLFGLANPIITTFLIGLVLFIAYQIYIQIFFSSEKFKNIKESIKEYTTNCNELNDHIEWLKCTHADIRSFDYGEGHLYDNSNFNFQRKEWSKNIKNHLVHNCSASVCKNASDQPFKYLCKYFDIKASEETLSSFEIVLNNFAAAEQGKVLLQNERDSILLDVSKSIPTLIFFFSKNKLIQKLGFEPIDLSDLYFPVFTFQYVSAGGNSSSKCDIKLNITNLDSFIKYLSEIVKFRKSVVGQRALMTSSLREKIKSRDNYTCQYCNLSTRDEQNLLLEIDHIIPLSKGGITSEDNLQTLCWKCNRTKGARIVLAS